MSKVREFLKDVRETSAGFDGRCDPNISKLISLVERYQDALEQVGCSCRFGTEGRSRHDDWCVGQMAEKTLSNAEKILGGEA